MLQARWSLRPYVDGDEAKILQLFRAVYPDSVTAITDALWLARWRWKYRQNPAGAGIVWVAEAKDRLVGHYALVPYNLKARHHQLKVGLGAGMMVHPEHRYRSPFAALGQAAHAEARDARFAYVIGFPNTNSYRSAIKRLAFVEVAETQAFYRPANLRTWLHKRLRIPVMSTIGATLLHMWFRRNDSWSDAGGEFREDNGFDASYDEFWERVSAHYPFAIDKGADFLRWRFAQVPQLTYKVLTLRQADQISAFVVYRQPEETAHANAVIYCLLAADARSLRCLLSRLLQELEQQAVNALCWSGLAEPWQYEALRRQGFTKVKSNLCSPLLITSLQQAALPAEIAHGPWMLHYGDSDML